MRILKRFFIFLFITSFVIMFVSQMMLKNSVVKTNLSRLYEIESQYVYSENQLADEYISIHISNPSENLFLLQNGEKTTVLNQKEMQINISDNSVIEIDGRNTDIDVNIKLVGTSEKIDGFYEENITVNSNIVILGRFFIK